MARASVHVSKSNTRMVTKTTTKTRVGKNRNKQKGNPNRCPVCGKFMGNRKSGKA